MSHQHPDLIVSDMPISYIQPYAPLPNPPLPQRLTIQRFAPTVWYRLRGSFVGAQGLGRGLR